MQSRKPHVRSDKYPKSISEWGLPSNIDGAFKWDNGRSYFFKDGQYWRFNDRRFAIDRSSRPFPRPTGPWWFGCPQVRPLMSDGDVNVLTAADDDTVEFSNSGDTDLDSNFLTAGNEDLDATSS